MPTLETWLADDKDALDEGVRASLAWRRIQDRPTSVAFKKPDGTILAAQTVRIEHSSDVDDLQSEAGTGFTRLGTILGVRNHPDSKVADTDIGEGYRFIHNNDSYQVVDTFTTLGEVQAYFRAIG